MDNVFSSKFTLYETRTKFYIIGSNQNDSHFKVLKLEITPSLGVEGWTRTTADQHYNNNVADDSYSKAGGSGGLSLVDDGISYSKQEIIQLLAMIEAGNNGRLRKVSSFFGIVGFVRFLHGYYLIIITKRSAVALLGGHYVYHVDDTMTIPLWTYDADHAIGSESSTTKNTTQEQSSNTSSSVSSSSAAAAAAVGSGGGGSATTNASTAAWRRSYENRYASVFAQVDLSKNFYFSYSYDITNTLQKNLSRLDKSGTHHHHHHTSTTTETLDNHENPFIFNDMFMWNYYLLKPALTSSSLHSDWVLPIIYGFVDQSKISVLGKPIIITLIARRSRFFAGARFLKRGVNDLGHVANDVETEQIVHDGTRTSFFEPSATTTPLSSSSYSLNLTRGYTSFVQHRGSIPLYWSQDVSNMAPKPPIILNFCDPFYSAAALHFDNMFLRYGAPIIVLNLVKAREKTKRESILLEEFTSCISYLNQFLPAEDKKIYYIAWDMARASKSNQDVIGMLERVAEEQVLNVTGFYHSAGDSSSSKSNCTQNGVVRTNCIDCLDRTNAAQFVIGKCALGHQLYALGVIATPQIPFDSDATNLLNAMYHDHGDTIALQYGGSHLVNTMETYRKMLSWTSHSRDMIESIRRYYSNSFTDAEKQDALNLFLGNFVAAKHHRPSAGGLAAVPLWEMHSDFFLHHDNRRPKRSYINWYTPARLNFNRVIEERDRSTSNQDLDHQPDRKNITSAAGDLHYWDNARVAILSDFFSEYYRPKTYTSYRRLFSFNMMGTETALDQAIPTRSSSGQSLNDLTSSFNSSPQHQASYDPSPFTARVNHHQQNSTLASNTSSAASESSTSNPTRHFMIYSLNIGGVKRWLTLNGKPPIAATTNVKTSRSPPPSSTLLSSSVSTQANQPIARSNSSASSHNSTSSSSYSPSTASIGASTGSAAKYHPSSSSSLAARLMEPSVSNSEYKDYDRYVSHFAFEQSGKLLDFAVPYHCTSTDSPNTEAYIKYVQDVGRIQVGAKDEHLYKQHIAKIAAASSFYVP